MRRPKSHKGHQYFICIHNNSWVVINNILLDLSASHSTSSSVHQIAARTQILLTGQTYTCKHNQEPTRRTQMGHGAIESDKWPSWLLLENVIFHIINSTPLYPPERTNTFVGNRSNDMPGHQRTRRGRGRATRHVNQIQISLSRMTCLQWLLHSHNMLIYGQKSINYNMFSVITCHPHLNYDRSLP